MIHDCSKFVHYLCRSVLRGADMDAARRSGTDLILVLFACTVACWCYVMSGTVSKILPLVYEVGVCVTVNDLERDFDWNVIVEICMTKRSL